MIGIFRFGLFSWILLATSIATVGLFFYLRTFRRNTPAAVYLAFLCLAGGILAFSNFFENAALTRGLKLTWSQISYFGSSTGPVFYFLFSLTFVHKERPPSLKAVAALFVVPAVTILLALTNDSHRLIWTGLTFQPGSTLAIYGHGPGFWIGVIGYSYAMILGGFANLGIFVRRLPRYYRMQPILVIFAMLLPLVGNALYNFGPNPVPGLDWTPVSFLAAASLLTFGVIRYRMLDLVPVARHSLVETMSDGILVLDDRGIILDVNLSLRNLLGGEKGEVIGRPADEVLASWPEILPCLDRSYAGRVEVPRKIGEDTLHFEVGITTLYIKKLPLHARLFTVRDTSRRKRLEEEREKLIAQLRETSTQVKTLEGLLPICASCKRIRDEDGTWLDADAFMEGHSRMAVTHGLCPECLGRYAADKK